VGGRILGWQSPILINARARRSFDEAQGFNPVVGSLPGLALATLGESNANRRHEVFSWALQEEFSD
jgi:Tfp pilus assembly protein PilN